MNKNVLTERDLMLIKEWYFNYVHDGKDTEESEALYYKIDSMLDNKFKDGTNLQVFWYDGDITNYVYNKNTQMFVNAETGSVFTSVIIDCKYDLEKFVQQADLIKDIKIIDGGM
ncbi:hypothetical protein PMX22_20145 [Clostridium butyricum]|jgi:hypothetical protein|uniref:hypothetical protein n=1 Tax=Clostridium butyricum TaxID=1492 RepID=UPI00205681C0|nr:hypothetical protein [Clostridium butyricum]MDB2162098.1 hypothetical protein [Clostridium butyricum]DAQ97614.1 MAG TPA: hypothetical protein [Caudoviricetes sp.]